MENSLIVLKLISVVYLLLLLPLYVVRSGREDKLEISKFKMTLSVTFCAVGLIGSTLNDFSMYAVFILFGLMASLAGDYFLIFMDSVSARFKAGILCFGLAHVFYIVAMVSTVGFLHFDVLVSIILYVLILYFTTRKKLDFGQEKYVLYIYGMLLVLMTVKALSMIYFSPYAMQSRLMMALGATLFMASDIFLAKHKYMKGSSHYRILNSITYFTGQLLIAASLFYTFI
ncbi:MAG: lysoplasmalogenase [Sedimentibacter sp.]|uniref:lysoplasmalogenase n=1 Tax=Sedimentibacter sp. TaxID=1960295 RepID=UPI00315943A8